MQTVDNGRMVGARTGTCMSQYEVQLQASICLQSIVILFEHRGEGTNLEFGKRCPDFTAPSCGRAVADSQNFWRLEVRTLFCRSNRLSNTNGGEYVPKLAISPALRWRSSERARKRISQNQLAPSRFFQNFRCDQTHN